MNVQQVLSQFRSNAVETCFHDRHIGPQILAGLQGEQAIRCGAAHLDAQLLGQMQQRTLPVAQLARQVGAHVDLVLAHRLLVVHVVKRGDLVHGHHRHVQVRRDLGFAVSAHKALLLLDDGQASHDC